MDATSGAAASWQPLTVPEPTLCLAVTPGVVYAGGTAPNLIAEDAVTAAPVSWDPEANGNVNALALDGSTLYVAGEFTTIGGQPQTGIAALTTVTLGVPGGSHVSAISLASPVPSPVRAQARIAFTLPTEAVVSLALYDVNGRRVASLLDQARLAVGEHSVNVDAGSWPAGCYWYDLTTGSEHLSRKLLVVR